MPLAGAIVPHAPLLLPEVAQAPSTQTEPLRRAVGNLRFEEADALLLLSPHGDACGVYRGTRGSLDGFGVRGVGLERATDPGLAEDLSRAWGFGFQEAPCDHGVTVPLSLGVGGDLPVVAAALPEATGPAPSSLDEILRAARAFAAALDEVSSSRSLAFVASANTSAGLTPRAPLTERPGAQAVENALIDALSTGVGALVELAPELARAGGSCGAGPLLVLGTLFPKARIDVLAYDLPFGVGYLAGVVSA